MLSRQFFGFSTTGGQLPSRAPTSPESRHFSSALASFSVAPIYQSAPNSICGWGPNWHRYNPRPLLKGTCLSLPPLTGPRECLGTPGSLPTTPVGKRAPFKWHEAPAANIWPPHSPSNLWKKKFFKEKRETIPESSGRDGTGMPISRPTAASTEGNASFNSQPSTRQRKPLAKIRRLRCRGFRGRSPLMVFWGEETGRAPFRWSGWTHAPIANPLHRAQERHEKDAKKFLPGRLILRPLVSRNEIRPPGPRPGPVVFCALNLTGPKRMSSSLSHSAGCFFCTSLMVPGRRKRTTGFGNLATGWRVFPWEMSPGAD